MNKESEPQPVNELTEAQFRLLIHRAVKNRGENEQILKIANELLNDIKRYKEMDVIIRFYEQGGNLWIVPEDKGELGFKT